MAKLKFFIRSAGDKMKWVRIRARFRVGSNIDCFAKTNLFIPKYAWDAKSQRVKMSYAKESYKNCNVVDFINKSLGDIESNVLLEFMKCRFSDINTSWFQGILNNDTKQNSAEKGVEIINYIDTYINEAKAGKRLTVKRGERFSISTIRSLIGFRKVFNDYLSVKRKFLKYEDIDMRFYFEFRDYMLKDKLYSLNTVGRILRSFKTIMYAAMEDGLHSNTIISNRRFKADNVCTYGVFINMERLDMMYDFSRTIKSFFSGKKVQNNIFYDILVRNKNKLKLWCNVLDAFLVGCYTGQRYSDYIRISKDMILNDNDKEMFRILQKKTKVTVLVPLKKEVKEILDYYGGSLNYVSEQRMNYYIKIICRELGFTEKIIVEETFDGEIIKNEYDFCDLVKTHTARRTLASNMYSMGVPISSIMAITGHSTEAVLRRYLKLDEVDKVKMLSDCSYFH